MGCHSCRHLGFFLRFSHCNKGWRGSLRGSRAQSLKYASITNTHIFVPVMVETLGSICSRCLSFLVEISKRLAAISGDGQRRSIRWRPNKCWGSSRVAWGRQASIWNGTWKAPSYLDSNKISEKNTSLTQSLSSRRCSGTVLKILWVRSCYGVVCVKWWAQWRREGWWRPGA